MAAGMISSGMGPSPQQRAERGRAAARERRTGFDQSNVNPIYKWAESVKNAARSKNPTFRPPFAPDSLRKR